MIALQGSFVKATEVLLLFPIHHNIHKLQANCKLPVQNYYKGVYYQIIQAPLNRFVDIHLYETYGTNIYSAFGSSLFKTLTYPLHTAEINTQLRNKLPVKLKGYYKGFIPYSIVNTSSYYIWFKSLEFYDNNLKIKNKNIHNCVVGFLSGLTVDIVCHPLKTIKTNLQNDTFTWKSLLRREYYSRALGCKLLLSACQTAYFNVLCNVTDIKKDLSK